MRACMVKPRVFHLTNLPDNVYVYLKDKFRKNLFERAFKIVGPRKELARKIGIHKSTLEGWYLGKRLNEKKETVPLSMPLWAIKKLLNFVNLKPQYIDKNVLFIRSRGKLIIKRPKLPLIESTDLSSLVGNFLGDCYTSSKTETPHYSNRNKKLRSEFKRKLKTFGNVPISLNPEGFYLRFPKVIADILKHLYQFECGTFNAYLPKALWKLPKNYSAATIGAIIDDDGTIADDKIEIYSASKKLLKDVQNLIRTKFPKIKMGKIIPKGKNYFFFQIYAESFKHIKNSIPILHPDKKENLEFNLKRQKLRPTGITFGKDNVKIKIIKLLSKKDLTAKEISRKLFIGRSTINEHLNHLRGEGKITFIKVNRGGKSISRLWRLTNGARKFRK